MSVGWWRGIGRRKIPAGAGLPASTGVAVVGAGLMGVSIARSLRRAGHNVALIDAGQPGVGASGDNIGIVDLGTAQCIAELGYAIGEAAAASIFAESIVNQRAVRELLQRRAPTALLPSSGFLSLWTRDMEGVVLRDSMLALASLGASASMLDASTCGTLLGVTPTAAIGGGAFRPQSLLVHPLMLLDVLLEDAVAEGVTLVCNMPVRAVEAGLVHCDRGALRAETVVLACNSGLDGLAPGLAPHLVPQAERVAVVRFARRSPLALSFGIDWGGTYGCMFDDDTALIGGLAVEHEPTVASVTAHLAPFVSAPAVIAVEGSWVGTVIDTPDERPLVGPYAPGLWVASAFGGQALPFVMTIGDLLVRGLAEGAAPVPAFAPDRPRKTA